MSTAQLTFDIETLIREADVAAAPAWTGAPMRYHEGQFTPAELDEAFNRYRFEFGNFGCLPYSHMWNRDATRSQFALTNANGSTSHTFDLFTADGRCDGDRFGHRDHSHAAGELPGKYMSQIICTVCNWRIIASNSSAAVEAWHDHALPGWRELPAVPVKLARHQGDKKSVARLHAWVVEHYPVAWQRPLMPIRTERPEGSNTHVAGRSPWGGYDLAVTC